MNQVPITMPAAENRQAVSRNPDRTRLELIEAAEREIHLHGYQAASLNKIIADAGVTKGALYYHFANKQSLGYAVLDEIWGPQMRAVWVEPLQQQGVNPINAMIKAIKTAGQAMSAQAVILGCPINNIAQEMSPIDEGFRRRVNDLLAQWREAIGDALRRGQAQGDVAKRLQPEAIAAMLVASIEGCVGMAKNAQSHELLMQCGAGVIDYLQTLRA